MHHPITPTTPASPRRARWLVVVMALLASTFLSAAPASAESACYTGCILQVSTQSGGGGIQVSARTSSPGIAILRVYEDAELTRDVANAARNFTSNQVSVRVEGLQPGREYYYRFIVRDPEGARDERRGTAKTLRRQVNVTFDRIVVVDDGDNMGAGELTISLRAHTDKLLGVYRDRSVTGPATLLPRRMIVVPNAPDRIRISTLVVDDDRTPMLDSCPVPLLGYLTFGKGSNVCADWGTAHFDLTLPPAGQSGRGNWQATMVGPVTFQVFGTWHVAYGSW